MESTGTTELEFTVRVLRDGETCAVRYVCECGCKPQARFKRGASEPGHEHCCCGIVHFAGPSARAALESYLADRRATGEDTDLTYQLREQQLTDPWGEPLSVAYALPVRQQ